MKVVHDHKTGTTTLHQGQDLYAFLQAATNGATVREAGRFIFGRDPNPEDIQKTRRRFDDLVLRGKARKVEGKKGGRGGRAGPLFLRPPGGSHRGTRDVRMRAITERSRSRGFSDKGAGQAITGSIRGLSDHGAITATRLEGKSPGQTITEPITGDHAASAITEPPLFRGGSVSTASRSSARPKAGGILRSRNTPPPEACPTVPGSGSWQRTAMADDGLRPIEEWERAHLQAFGAQLRNFRKMAGLSQPEVAVGAMLSERQVSRLEHGERRPRRRPSAGSQTPSPSSALPFLQASTNARPPRCDLQLSSSWDWSGPPVLPSPRRASIGTGSSAGVTASSARSPVPSRTKNASPSWWRRKS